MRSPLLRNLFAAVAGFVAMAALVFASFSVVWLLLGPEGAFRQGTWDVSGGWIAASIAIGFGAALVGGWLCARLAASHQAVAMLIGIIVVMSVWSALAASGAEAAVGPRPAEVTMAEAMNGARQPSWVMWLNPILGVVGAIVGARLVRGREGETP